uniref:Medaka-type gonadotropin-releasing hormone n=1 Tax=Pseudolabrus sieboldi TaxID=98377 RepID=T2BPI3_9LABR|nr:medaka-type gonadotropin-releasing hormone precursor [Pseudolabrus sieboldi]
MAAPSLALWLLLVGAVIPPGCCQHWSFGLSPGGKRELDNLSDTLDNIVKGFPPVDAPCSVLGCEEEFPIAKSCRQRGALGSVTKSGHIKYEK